MVISSYLLLVLQNYKAQGVYCHFCILLEVTNRYLYLEGGLCFFFFLISFFFRKFVIQDFLLILEKKKKISLNQFRGISLAYCQIFCQILFYIHILISISQHMQKFRLRANLPLHEPSTTALNPLYLMVAIEGKGGCVER